MKSGISHPFPPTDEGTYPSEITWDIAGVVSGDIYDEVAFSVVDDGGLALSASGCSFTDWSGGSCYETTTHTVTCNVAEEDCPEYWYEPGYVSPYSGCCHCAASCDHDAEWGSDCEGEYYDHEDDEDDEEGDCRCCEAVFDVGAPECDGWISKGSLGRCR